jgi:C4-dicarboxylate transporter DctQ subunit
MKTLLKINQWIGIIEYYLIAFSVIGMAILLIINAVGRTVFHYSLTFSGELCEILVIMLTFIGLSNAARNGKHVSMTAIYDKLSKNHKRIMNIFISLVCCILLLFITYLCITYVIKVHVNGRFTTVLNIPMYLIVSIMPIGCILGSLQYFIQFILSVQHKDTLYSGSEKIEEDLDMFIEKKSSVKPNNNACNTINSGGD